MKKFFIILLFSLFCFLPLDSFALTYDKNTTFADLTPSEIAEWSSYYINFDNYIVVDGSNYWYFYALFDDEVPYYNCPNSTSCYLYLRSSSRDITSNQGFSRYSYAYLKTQKVYNRPGPYSMTSAYNVINVINSGTTSSIDILNNDGTLFMSKNTNYSKPSCPTCEECEECEECDNVNIDFPITKEEFYILLVFLAVIILLIFFKWTFGERGRK